jgi:hypothetical protein
MVCKQTIVGQWIAVALGQPFDALLPIAGTGQATNLQFHQPLGREANHLPQQIGVGVLLNKRTKLHHLVGHWWFLGKSCVRKPTLTGKSPMTARKPVRSLRRY